MAAEELVRERVHNANRFRLVSNLSTVLRVNAVHACSLCRSLVFRERVRNVRHFLSAKQQDEPRDFHANRAVRSSAVTDNTIRQAKLASKTPSSVIEPDVKEFIDEVLVPTLVRAALRDLAEENLARPNLAVAKSARSGNE